MPSSKPKPSEIATEAKRIYIPYINKNMPNFPARSICHPDSSYIPVPQEARSTTYPRVAVMEGDPIDVALGWYDYAVQNQTGQQAVAKQIPVVNMANERRPGGDWESGLLAPEECFARRSNLAYALKHPWNPGMTGSDSNYPIPSLGGMYTPSVVIFRDGADMYDIWREFKTLPVISAAPVRRPKLDESGTRYSFQQERDLMQDKMRTILRIAAHYQYCDICLGAFGTGPVFRNPVREIAEMWKELLFEEEEFRGVFTNVVFAIDTKQAASTRTSREEFEIFTEVFDPSHIFRSG